MNLTTLAQLIDPSWRSPAEESGLAPPGSRPLPALVDFHGRVSEDSEPTLRRLIEEGRRWPFAASRAIDPVARVGHVAEALAYLADLLPERALPAGFALAVELGVALVPTAAEPADPVSPEWEAAARAEQIATEAGLTPAQEWLMRYASSARGPDGPRGIIGWIVRVAELLPPLELAPWLDAQIGWLYRDPAGAASPASLAGLTEACRDSVEQAREAMDELDELVAALDKKIPRVTAELLWRHQARALEGWVTALDQPANRATVGVALAAAGRNLIGDSIVWSPVGGPREAPVYGVALTTNIVGASALLGADELLRTITEDNMTAWIEWFVAGGWGRAVESGTLVEAVGDRTTSVFPSAEAALACAHGLLRAAGSSELRWWVTNGKPLPLRIGIGVPGPVRRTERGCGGLAVVSARRLCDAAAQLCPDRGTGAILLPASLADQATMVGLGLIGDEQLTGLQIENLPMLEVRTAGLHQTSSGPAAHNPRGPVALPDTEVKTNASNHDGSSSGCVLAVRCPPRTAATTPGGRVRRRARRL